MNKHTKAASFALLAAFAAGVALLLLPAPQLAQGGVQLDQGEVSAAAAMATGSAVQTEQVDDLWAAALAESGSAPAAAPVEESKPAAPAHPKLSGPVVDPNAQDVVTSQSQVDELLASLGF